VTAANWSYPVFWARPAGMTPTARAARERHEFHLLRAEREQQERAARLAAKAAASADATRDSKHALIAAAMERARTQRAAAEPRNTVALTPEQLEQIARVEARRARLRESASRAGAQASGDDGSDAAHPPAPRSRE
jgi:H+/Na+-translocating ferredoxin:NAD+ oxidoreductase subunit C